jgi:hypothetical protein
MPTARVFLTSCVIDWNIYVAGGLDTSYHEVGTLEIFDSSTNSWSTGPSMPIGLGGCTSCVVDGKIYVMGGEEYGNTLEIFDPSSNTWSVGPDIPEERPDLASQALGGVIYAIGGDLENGKYTYDIFTPGPSGVASPTSPSNFILLVAFPNPLTQSTTISFTWPESGVAEVTIVNLLGEEVARVFSGALQSGEHSFSWDASGMPPGIYECLVRMNGNVERVGMVLAR